ncbi:hypothetical protein VC34_03035 [Pseudomonas fluorescens]|uniref:Uncharacterized protein n=1 Tax=Pseudomonas fluorescens TaxID=294 RepID=A0A0F4TW45_PSEFL|nr:hypothetical protein VC34_03035 [Pseudomonas fluorescens]
MRVGMRRWTVFRSPPPQDKSWHEGKLPEALNKARAHPQWSSLNAHPKLNPAERQEQIEVLAHQL